MKALAALLLLPGLVLGLAACSGDDDPEASQDRPSRPAATSLPATLELAETDVCGRVRDGIDAFNLGDLTGTIEAFQDAVGPAEDLARDQPSDDTETLLDAVRYYADLPAGDYLEASASSPEFLRFKDFTLRECAYTGVPQEATDPAIPA